MVVLVAIAADFPSPHHQGAVAGGGRKAQLDLTVSGMTCSSCAAIISKVVSRVEGVAAVEVCPSTGLARVILDHKGVSSWSLTVAAILRAINKLTGYSAKRVVEDSPDNKESVSAKVE